MFLLEIFVLYARSSQIDSFKYVIDTSSQHGSGSNITVTCNSSSTIHIVMFGVYYETNDEYIMKNDSIVYRASSGPAGRFATLNYSTSLELTDGDVVTVHVKVNGSGSQGVVACAAVLYDSNSIT